MSHSKKGEMFWREAPTTVCGGCHKPQNHHGLCLACLRLQEAAELPEPEAVAAAVPEPPVELPPPHPLGTALADLLGGVV